jgi:hypothetical protein
MANEAHAEAEGDAAAAPPAEAPRTWQPSRKPEHRIDQVSPDDHGLIIERGAAGGIIAAFARYLKRPFVKLVLGLGLFILGAIIYDATINFGRWTERPAKQKATPHKGLRPVPETPDG